MGIIKDVFKKVRPFVSKSAISGVCRPTIALGPTRPSRVKLYLARLLKFQRIVDGFFDCRASRHNPMVQQDERIVVPKAPRNGCASLG